MPRQVSARPAAERAAVSCDAALCSIVCYMRAAQCCCPGAARNISKLLQPRRAALSSA